MSEALDPELAKVTQKCAVPYVLGRPEWQHRQPEYDKFVRELHTERRVFAPYSHRVVMTMTYLKGYVDALVAHGKRAVYVTPRTEGDEWYGVRIPEGDFDVIVVHARGYITLFHTLLKCMAERARLGMKHGQIVVA